MPIWLIIVVPRLTNICRVTNALVEFCNCHSSHISCVYIAGTKCRPKIAQEPLSGSESMHSPHSRNMAKVEYQSRSSENFCLHMQLLSSLVFESSLRNIFSCTDKVMNTIQERDAVPAFMLCIGMAGRSRVCFFIGKYKDISQHSQISLPAQSFCSIDWQSLVFSSSIFDHS